MYFLGKIEVPAGEARNNVDTVTPFPVTRSPVLLLQPSTDGLCAEMGYGNTWNTTEERGAILPAGNTDLIRVTPWLGIPGEIVLSVFNPNDTPAYVRVWAT